MTPKRSDPFFRSCNRWIDSIFIFFPLVPSCSFFLLHSMNHLTFYEITFMPPLFFPIFYVRWSSLPIFWLILNFTAFSVEQKKSCRTVWGARGKGKQNYNSAREKNGNLILTKEKRKQSLWCWFLQFFFFQSIPLLLVLSFCDGLRESFPPQSSFSFAMCLFYYQE